MATQLERLAEVAGCEWREIPPIFGYRCDGDQSWRVEPRVETWWIHYRHGWYEQIGEVPYFDDVIVVMRAMRAADAALWASLREQGALP